MRLYARAGQKERALAQFAVLEEALAALDTEPAPETIALRQVIAEGKVAPYRLRDDETIGAISPPPQLPWTGLPCLGREREREQISQLLNHNGGRLLSLLGIGGIGKTRLALQAGEDCRETFPDGVYFVPLADARGLNAMVTATAVAVGFSFQEGGNPKGQLLGFLWRKQSLLIFDNFEHLLMHRAFISELLSQTETLKILVTSRERLGVVGEQSLLIEGLAYPPPGEKRWLESYPAVQLFIHCARLVDPEFYLTAENRSDIAAICAQVAGMPLGVRLAAALTRLHPPRQIAEDLAHHVDFPQEVLSDAPARQRSIGAVFHYSWQRLRAEEQVALCRLAIFRGGFTWEAAQEVSDAERGVLVALVDKSLISRNTLDRFEIHELIRQHAEQKLLEMPFAGETRQRHARYYLEFLQAHVDGGNPDEPSVYNEIALEIENLRTGWLWSLENGSATEIQQYVELLGQYYQKRHQYREAIELYTRIFELSAQLSSRCLTATLTADIYTTAHWQRLWGEALYKTGEMQQSRHHLEAALKLLDTALPQQRVLMATSVELLRQVAYRLSPWRLSRRSAERRQKISLEAALTYERLGQILYFANQSEQAVYTAIRGLNLAERCGPSPVLARLYANTCLGVATEPWFRSLAALYGRLALETAHTTGDEAALGWVLELVGMYRAGIADWNEGLLLIEHSIEVHERIGNPRQREEGLAVLAFIHQCRGRSSAALAAWRRAFDSAYQRDDRQVQMWSLSGIVENLMINGREEQIAQALPGKAQEFGVSREKPVQRIWAILEQAKQFYDEIGDMAAQISAYAFLALIALRGGDNVVALEQARQALKLVQTTSPMTFSNMDGYAVVTEVLFTLWEKAIEDELAGTDWMKLETSAQAACDALHKYAQAFPVAQPHALRWQGRRSWLNGQHNRAIRLWESGQRLAEQLDMPYIHAQIEVDMRQARSSYPLGAI
jgi:predicted ATPase